MIPRHLGNLLPGEIAQNHRDRYEGEPTHADRQD
jgi:hypothetical protein